MLDSDTPNLDNFLPFSLRDVAIARAFLNGKYPIKINLKIKSIFF
jgi:hypothetical protein